MRDNLGAIGLATSIIEHRHPNSVMIILWGADHVVKKESAFLDAICKAAELAYENDKIVHVDTYATYPTVHNGWMKIGKQIKKDGKHVIYDFEEQIEKPDLKTAQKLFKSKNHLIHVGYMATKPSLLLSYYQKYAPNCFKRLQKIQAVIDTPEYQKILEKEYPQFEKVSVDYGLFEKLPPQSQWELPVDMGWIDVGTWELLFHGLKKDSNGNVVIGQAHLIDVKDSLIINHDHKTVGVIGMSGVIVVNTDGGLLICPLDQAPKVKDLYNFLYSD